MKRKPASVCPDFRPCAEAILVKAHHATPLPPGARIWVESAGAYSGAISMGCVDHDVVERLRMLARGNERTAWVSYGRESDREPGGVGLMCGGCMEVLLRRVPAPDPVAAALEELTADAEYVLVTNLSEAHAGCQRLYVSGSSPQGSCGEAALDRKIDGGLDTLASKPGAHVQECASVSLLVERYEAPPSVLLVGASGIATHLCRFATQTGYRVCIVDPRRELVRPDRFPDAALLDTGWPEEAFGRLQVDASWYVAVLAHDLKLDLPALREALRRNCGYVGLLGSAGTQRKHREQLRAEGVGEESLGRIRGPIGLALGAVTTEEIAIAILAEMIQTRRT